MKKIIIISVFLLLAIGVITFLYFKNLQILKQQADPFGAIPESATLVIDLQNSSDFFNLYRSSTMINDFLGEETLKKNKSLYHFFIQNTYLKKHFDNKRILVSIHCPKGIQPDLLYLIAMEQDKAFEKFIKNTEEKGLIPISSKENNQQTEIYTIHIKEINNDFYLSFYNGLLIGSFSKNLVKESLDRLIDQESHVKNNFKLVRMGESPNVQASVYVNYSKLPVLLAMLVNKPTPWLNEFLFHLAQWSVLNLNYKTDAVMFNGSTAASDTSYTYLTLFNGQRPQKSEISTVLSASSAIVLDFALSNFHQFKIKHHALLLHKGQLANHEKTIAAINSNYKVDFENELNGIISNEFALVVNSNSGENVLANQLAFVKVVDTAITHNFMNKISSFQSITTYKTFAIQKTLIADFLPIAFGSIFTEMRSPYFIIVQNYLVFGTNVGVLQHYIDDYLSMKSLEKAPDYQDLKQYISDQCNINLYVNIKNSKQMLDHRGTELLRSRLKNDSTDFNNFYALSIQLSNSGNGQFFTDFYLNYRPGITKKVVDSIKIKLVRSINLDDEFSMQPQVLNYPNKDQAIVVQDERNQFYYLSISGNLLWKLKLVEPIISRCYPASWNGQSCLTFNTRSRLYAMDTNGKTLKGFPINIKAKASVGISIFDYDGNYDFRIFVPADDRSITVYNLDAKQVSGWNPKRNVGLLQQPIQLAKVGGDSFLFAYTKEKRFWYFGWKGEVIASGELNVPVKNKFYVITGSSKSESRFVSTDTLGDIKTIFFDGKIGSKTLGTWSGNHFFALANIVGNEQDYVFLDKNQLFVYDPTGTVIYNYGFESDISTVPQFFKDVNSKTLLGITSGPTRQLFLFRSDGSILPGFPLTGATPFDIQTINESKKQILIAGDGGHKLFIYSLN